MEEDFKSMNSRENEQLKVTSQAEVADAARMAGDYQIIDNYLCIRMPEEVDHHRSDEICKNADHYILESQVGNVVFDFEDTHFMDSSGIGILIEDTSSFPASEERFLCFMRAGRSGVCSSLPGWTELWKSWNETFNQRRLPCVLQLLWDYILQMPPDGRMEEK
ncbi:MAG: STAS domain-containing protein [Eisenbergiella massiliensis]